MGHLVCGKHKTAKYYGSIAKWTPPGLQEAFVVFCEVPGKTSDLFFEPSRGDPAGHFHFGSALKSFGSIYTPGFEFPRINLLRPAISQVHKQHTLCHHTATAASSAIEGQRIRLAGHYKVSGLLSNCFWRTFCVDFE